MRRAGDVRLSVIVPVYNLEAWLPATLASLLEIGGSASGDGSRGLAVEIIAVDDGSPDRSGRIAEEYAARYPGLIRVIHQENGGLGAARNAGLAAAEGEFLFFLDSDDSLSPGALEEFYLSQTLKGLDYGPEELAALCELVTVDDVRAVCAGMELDAVYFLHGDAEDAEEEEADDDAEA